MNLRLIIALSAILATFSFALAEDPTEQSSLRGQTSLGGAVTSPPENSDHSNQGKSEVEFKAPQEPPKTALPAPLKEAQVTITNIINSCCPCPKRTANVASAKRSYQKRFRSNPLLRGSTVKQWEQKLNELADKAVKDAVNRIVHNTVQAKVDALAPVALRNAAPKIVREELNKQLAAGTKKGTNAQTAMVAQAFQIPDWVWYLLGVALGLALFYFFLIAPLLAKRKESADEIELGVTPHPVTPVVIQPQPQPQVTPLGAPAVQQVPVQAVPVAAPVSTPMSVPMNAPVASSESLNAAPETVLDAMQQMLESASTLTVKSHGGGYEIRARRTPEMAAAAAGVPANITMNQYCGCTEPKKPATRSRTK